MSSEMPAAPCGLPSPPIPSLRSARVGRAAHCPLRETSRRRGSFVSSEMPAAPCGLPSPPIPSLRSARVGRAAHCPLRETSRRRGSFVSSEMPAAPCGLPSPPIPSLRSARIGRAAHPAGTLPPRARHRARSSPLWAEPDCSRPPASRQLSIRSLTSILRIDSYGAPGFGCRSGQPDSATLPPP